MEEENHIRLKRNKVLLSMSLIATVLIMCVIPSSLIKSYFNLWAELELIDAEISKKSTEENFVKTVLTDEGFISVFEVHIKNYEDQLFVRRILSNCSYMTGPPPVFMTSEFYRTICIGSCRIDITNIGFPLIGSYGYRMGPKDRSRLRELLFTVPGYR